MEVAQLAGIPAEVLHLATDHLNLVQQQSIQQPVPTTDVKPLAPVLRELAKVDADNLSAREALELVYRLKALEASEIAD